MKKEQSSGLQLKGWVSFLIIALGFCLGSTSLANQYDMQVFVDRDSLGDIKPSTGQVTVRWQEKAPEVCFYLAFNDPHFFWDPSRNIHRSMNKNKSFRPSRGQTYIDKSSVPYTVDGPILRMKNQGSVHFDFSFVLPQWPDRAKKQFLFHQFYPQKLTKCPETQNLKTIQVASADFNVNVSYPRRWALTSPGFHNQGTIKSKGRYLSFNLSIDHQVEHFFVNKIPVTIVYKSKFMNRAKFHLQRFLEGAEAMLGPYPFPRLLFIETEDLEKDAIPGVITLNRPRQSGMEAIQNQLLNWGLWQLAYYTSQQWFGASLHPETQDDAWFFRGTADFIASLLLKQDEQIYNIFNADDGKPWISLNHSQSGDLIASVLGILRPENALVDSQLNSVIEYLEQHNFSYIRHLLAMRFAHWYDPDHFLDLLGDFSRDWRKKRVRPSQFVAYLNSVDSKLGKYLSDWWTSSQWPDFSVEKAEQDGDQLHVTVGQNEKFMLPYDIVVDTQSGKKLKFRGEAKAGKNTFSLKGLNSGEIKRVEINPSREIFDSNRFNNHNQVSEVVFFPGNADTIRDDAYTVVWFPFPSKLPGEELSLMLSSQVFKYVNSGLSVLVNHIPSEQQTGFNALFLTDIKWASAYASLNVVQEFGTALKGQRIIDANFSKSNLFSSIPGLTLGLRVRQRGTVGVPESNHGTAAMFSSFEPVSISSCGLNLYGIYESSLGVVEGFSYKRNFGVASWGCQNKDVGFSFRTFWGAVEEDGEPPNYVKFSPQTLDEAKLRIDQPSLQPVRRLWTVSIDVDLPAHLPIPSALFLLPRHSRWRFFYDYGYTDDLDSKYQDYGIGFRLPFGGDIVGKRSLSFASLSVLSVLHKTYEGKSSDRPGLLIDFLGKL